LDVRNHFYVIKKWLKKDLFLLFCKKKKITLIIRTDMFLSFYGSDSGYKFPIFSCLCLECALSKHMLPPGRESVGLKCFSNVVQFFLYETFR